MKKIVSAAFKQASISALALFLAVSLAVPAYAQPLRSIPSGFAKNVILMIPDGMSHSGVTLARWVYNNGDPLHMDEIASGLMMTHNADTAIADSAPAGTAMATGYKTQDKLIGVKPLAATLPGSTPVVVGEGMAPIANILEAAKLAGKSTGLVATSEIQHATPADFSAHAIHRGMYTNIGEQQVYQMMDVVLGGGADYLLPDTTGSKDPKSKQRIDGENMVFELKQLGYNYVTSRKEMLSVTSGKLWGGFKGGALDRNIAKSDEQPSLAEMTEKSIDLLSKNKKGFFLMVEGSQVDWAAHGNQTIGVISEIKAFDDAVGVALDYAKSNKDTVVIVATDHGNGGISIGDMSTSGTYPEHPIQYFTSVLKLAKLSEQEAAAKVNTERTNFKDVVASLGIADMTEAEDKALIAAKGKDASGKAFDNTLKLLTAMVNQRAHIGWTTGGHTGEDVVLYVYTADYRQRLSGTVQNSDIARYAAQAMGIQLDQASKALYVPHVELEKRGFKVTVDPSQLGSAMIVVEKQGVQFKVLENKNAFLYNGYRKYYNGVNIYNGDKFYLPQAAVDLMEKMSKVPGK